MLSFEDFFIKKRIDVSALKADDPTLYRELKAHYHIMGEKSFDHSKKFRFNPLRKSYLLKETETIKTPVINLSSSINDVNLKTPEKPSTKPAGFKPRFKASSTPEVKSAEAKSQAEKANDTIEKTEDNEAPKTTKPAGFKPRFKASSIPEVKSAETKSKAEKANDTIEKTEDNEAPKTTKPAGFKPRFKANTTINTEKKNNQK